MGNPYSRLFVIQKSLYHFVSYANAALCRFEHITACLDEPCSERMILRETKCGCAAINERKRYVRNWICKFRTWIHFTVSQHRFWETYRLIITAMLNFKDYHILLKSIILVLIRFITFTTIQYWVTIRMLFPLVHCYK